jgi:hypothetical protein
MMSLPNHWDWIPDLCERPKNLRAELGSCLKNQRKLYCAECRIFACCECMSLIHINEFHSLESTMSLARYFETRRISQGLFDDLIGE